MMLTTGLSAAENEVIEAAGMATEAHANIVTELAIEYGDTGSIGGSVIVGTKTYADLLLFAHGRSNKYKNDIYLKEIDVNIAQKLNDNVMVYGGAGALAINYNNNVVLKKIKPFLTAGVVFHNWGYSINFDSFIHNRDNCSARISLPIFMHKFDEAIVDFAVYGELNRFDAYSFNNVGVRVGVAF